VFDLMIMITLEFCARSIRRNGNTFLEGTSPVICKEFLPESRTARSCPKPKPKKSPSLGLIPY
jgi:hypothetical protein